MIGLRNYILTLGHYTCTGKNKEFVLNRMMEQADESGEPLLQCACQILFDIEHDIDVNDEDYLNSLEDIYTRPILVDAAHILQEVMENRKKKFNI